MAYFAPYIDSSGFHISSYQDTLDDLIAQYKAIYGQDVYLGTDTADYQWISIVALRIFDCNQASQLVYNNRSPKTAVGGGLEPIVKINGIRKKAASYSTCEVTLTGTASTTILNGIVSDVNGNKWDLPSSVTIGGGGTVTVTATAQTIGSITALPGDISTISTPTLGWVSVTNAAAAALGQPVETDTALRLRQEDSVALPSQTLVAGTASAIANITNVVRQKVYENDTDAVDINGIPRHSIAAVVEGGDDDAIAQIIFDNKGMGCGTFGTTTRTVTDPFTLLDLDINFSRPSYVGIYISLNIHALYGYNSVIGDSIKQAVADYLNSLQIGDDVSVGSIYAAALSVTDIKKPTFSVQGFTLGTSPTPVGTTDIVIAYNQAAQGDTAHILIALV